MSKSFQNFEYAIQDAEELLNHFDALNENPPSQNAEVLKRAALVMMLTAWETYVEDRLTEEMSKRLDLLSGCHIGAFVLKKLRQDLKHFHNPKSDNTKRLFQEYLGLDVTEGWSWLNYDPEKAKTVLNNLISKRGEAVHRSRHVPNGSTSAHLVKREDLVKAIRFIKDLVTATDTYIDRNFENIF